MNKTEKNIYGETLLSCCTATMTGFFRDSFCRTDGQDRGVHIVCAIMNDDFLEFSRARGNNLTTPRPEYGFPDLKAGDKWCLCAERWMEAEEAECAPPIDPKATDQKMLEYASIELLEKYTLDKE